MKKRIVLVIVMVLIFFVLYNVFSNLKIDKNKLTEFVDFYYSLFETKTHAIVALLTIIIIILVGFISIVLKSDEIKTKVNKKDYTHCPEKFEMKNKEDV